MTSVLTQHGGGGAQRDPHDWGRNQAAPGRGPGGRDDQGRGRPHDGGAQQARPAPAGSAREDAVREINMNLSRVSNISYSA